MDIGDRVQGPDRGGSERGPDRGLDRNNQNGGGGDRGPDRGNYSHIQRAPLPPFRGSGGRGGGSFNDRFDCLSIVPHSFPIVILFLGDCNESFHSTCFIIYLLPYVL